MRPIRVVSPFRPFAPESGAHIRLGPFDWLAALRMLAGSVARSNRCETVALTDEAADLAGFPAFRHAPRETRLMLWILEASAQYLASDDFDRDTVMVSPDNLVLGDLRPHFKGELALLVRTREKYKNRPILNAVQWWPVAAKPVLAGFYAEALAVARELPENVLRWGADSESIRRLIAPIAPGIHRRAGLDVSMVEAVTVLHSISDRTAAELAAGRRPAYPPVPVIDFKGERKRHMAAFYRATLP